MQGKDRHVFTHQVPGLELENQNIQAVAESFIYFVLVPVQ